jgi:thioredoxin
MSDPEEVPARSFSEEVLEAEGPVVVEFFSHSCPHCIKFNPIYKELSEILAGEARFLRVDVLASEVNRLLAHDRGVRSVPTIQVVYQGRTIGSITGYHHLEKVYEGVKGFLAKKDEFVGPSTPIHELIHK